MEWGADGWRQEEYWGEDLGLGESSMLMYGVFLLNTQVSCWTQEGSLKDRGWGFTFHSNANGKLKKSWPWAEEVPEEGSVLPGCDTAPVKTE